MGKTIVRAVDSGNIQRSPTFQAIFNFYFSQASDSPFQITFDSAGIDVDKIMENETPALKKLSILDAGLYYDLIEGKDKDLAEELIYTWFHFKEEEIPDAQKTIITDLYAPYKTAIHTIQMKFRNEALIEAGIPESFLPDMRVPFRHDEHLKLILPVEMPVVNKVEKYYQTQEADIEIPQIILYGDLVGTDPLPDTLKGGMETARRQVEYFMETRERGMGIFKTLVMAEGEDG